jgi:hypothetical protein
MQTIDLDLGNKAKEANSECRKDQPCYKDVGCHSTGLQEETKENEESEEEEEDAVTTEELSIILLGTANGHLSENGSPRLHTQNAPKEAQGSSSRSRGRMSPLATSSSPRRRNWAPSGETEERSQGIP